MCVTVFDPPLIHVTVLEREGVELWPIHNVVRHCFILSGLLCLHYSQKIVFVLTSDDRKSKLAITAASVSIIISSASTDELAAVRLPLPPPVTPPPSPIDRRPTPAFTALVVPEGSPPFTTRLSPPPMITPPEVLFPSSFPHTTPPGTFWSLRPRRERTRFDLTSIIVSV